MRKCRIFFPVLMAVSLSAGCSTSAAGSIRTEQASASAGYDEIQNYTRYADYTPVQAENAGFTAGTDKNVLVAYFSRSVNTSLDGVDAVSSASLNISGQSAEGNAQQMAEWIAAETGGTLYPIQTLYTYPADYDQTVEVGEGQDNDRIHPELINPIDISSYDQIFLVYPIWHFTLPAPMVSFLTDYDLSGKTVYCYTTSVSSGFADTIERIREEEPEAEVVQGITIPQSRIDEAEEEVRSSAAEMLEENGTEQEKDTMGKQIQIQIGNQTFAARLEENDTAEAFLEKLPLTIEMRELNGNEKYAFDCSLPSHAESVGSIQTGDLMLYGRDCLVLFYDSFPTGYQYTRIGRITDPEGLADAAGSGSVTITFTD
ncbi:MAG: cyclophilin-like fold protein [Bulleidia sp.]